MKHIFKKNQIIITALALMICVAGYLQFAGIGEDSKETEGDSLYFAADGSGTEEGKETFADISEEDMYLVQKENESMATETGTESEDASNVGEAIFVSTTIGGNFATNAKIVREQRRAQSKETLMGIINNELLTEEQKASAIETLVSLTTIAEKENAAELLLEAKGFEDPVVNIVDNQVDVVINASVVTDQQVAQIEDIVTRKTGFEPKNIVITAAIQED